MTALTIYGIRNCDTMKRARAWLDGQGIAYAFHDYKTAGIAGTTFRKLPEPDRAGLTEKKAIALMLSQPSMIKRPVLELGQGKLLVGFSPTDYAKGLKV